MPAVNARLKRDQKKDFEILPSKSKAKSNPETPAKEVSANGVANNANAMMDKIVPMLFRRMTTEFLFFIFIKQYHE